MRFQLFPVVTAAACAIAIPAQAQKMTVSVTPIYGVGMPVKDASGAPVGTVTAIDGDNLRVKTDKHELTLPKSSFSAGNGALVSAVTQAQLDAQVEQTVAAANAAIAPGATVNSSDGKPLGKVDSVGDGKVIVTLDAGSKFAVPQEGARGNADGTVTIGYTAAQIAALGTAKPAGQ